MRKKNTRNTKSKIVSAAWKLFYEQGYEDTTIEDIVFESGTSKGSFYHYFAGKDALLSSLSYLFDERYEELADKVDNNMNAFDKLMYFNRDVFKMIESTVSLELLARMYSTQLVTKSEKHLLDRTRIYYKLISRTASEGMAKGELKGETPNEIVKVYAMCERALLYDWCICNGEYSLSEYSAKMLPKLMESYKGQSS